METTNCPQCREELLDVEGVDTDNGRFCSQECADNYQQLVEDGVLEETRDRLADAPIVNFTLRMIPHVVVDPCPNCEGITEMYGTATPGATTPYDPFIACALAGKTFGIKCANCGAIMKVERPLIQPANSVPGQRQIKP